MNEPEFDVVVVGGVNTDYTIRGPRLPGPGSTVQGSDFERGLGGKGANQAVAAARLGARVALLARVGDDEWGTRCVERLDAEGVDTHAVIRDAGAPTGAALVMVDKSGEKQILTSAGANHDVSESDIAGRRSLFVCATVALIQLEIPVRAAAAAIRLARAAGARVILDPSPAVPLSEEVLRDLHVIRPNAVEAEIITGVRVVDASTARVAARNLVRRGVGAACVAAPGGNYLASGEFELWLPNFPTKSVDKTGAGDAFAAGLAVAIADGQPLDRAARFAAGAAALTAARFGAHAGLPRKRDVLAMLEDLDGDGDDHGGFDLGEARTAHGQA